MTKEQMDTVVTNKSQDFGLRLLEFKSRLLLISCVLNLVCIITYTVEDKIFLKMQKVFSLCHDYTVDEKTHVINHKITYMVNAEKIFDKFLQL